MYIRNSITLLNVGGQNDNLVSTGEATNSSGSQESKQFSQKSDLEYLGVLFIYF